MKFFVGDEHTGLHRDKIEWISNTFSHDEYYYVDEGWLYYEKHVVFIKEKDALLFRLRWL